MNIELSRIDNDFNFEARNAQGNGLLLDASPEAGGANKGLRPMELLLAALGSCSAIDVVSILKKQKQHITAFDISVNGDREKVKEYTLFKSIHLHFKLTGNIDKDKAQRAIQLSLDKYCSVAKTLEPTARITHQLTITKHEG